MRILKLVIWDLDETILTGILEEGDKDRNPSAAKVMLQLRERGVLQALATQNQPEVFRTATQNFEWLDVFVHTEVDLDPKIDKIKRIVDKFDINPLDTLRMSRGPMTVVGLTMTAGNSFSTASRTICSARYLLCP